MKVTEVTAARIPQYCSSCRTEIPVGAPYKYFSKRYGGKKAYCLECRIRPSDMTGGKRAQGLRIGEDLFESVRVAQTVDDVVDALRGAAEDATGLGEEYRESVENIESGFGHSTVVSEELSQLGDEFEDWAERLRTAADDCEMLRTDSELDPEFADDPDRRENDKEDRPEDVLEEARRIAEEAGDECPA